MNQEGQSRRKIKKGVVVSNKMNKTVVVKVERTIRHPRYEKIVTRAKKYYAHNESTPLNIGDEVKIMETRPLSKLKRWRVVA
ncbi:MAG: 30S ribosomal protein S17 [Parachlamydiaceae bacterium]